MDRNTNNFFASIPQIDVKRSRFDRSHSLATTFSSGKLIPIYYDDVLPGDTVTLDTSVVCRMSTPIFPVMGDCFLDVFYFFVPNRLVWRNWSHFMGEDDATSWDQSIDYAVPGLVPYIYDDESFKFDPGTLADYFGLPVSPLTHSHVVSALPFRAYYLIWNEYFRAQAVQDPVWINEHEDVIGILPISDFDYTDYVNEAFTHLALMPVGKFHDYFTSCLPSPQKGQPVYIPLNGTSPVLTSAEAFGTDISRNILTGYTTNGNSIDVKSDGSTFIPNNLYVDLNSSDFVSVNDLRMAVSVQHFLEMSARGGSRYIEIIKTFFGVTSPDARLQRPEYLGGKRIPINVDQVVQTSSTDNTSPLGNTGAFSLTGDKDSSFTYSATEHGMIIGLACVRPRHTYQFGIERKFSRRSRFDYYFPCFANISEQPVYLKELNALGSTIDEVFGYQEAWADYRYSQNKITGNFRPDVPDSLSPWVYTDYSNSSDVIDSSFISEDPAIIGDTLAYDSKNNTSQFLADFYFKEYWTRPMPVYSVPGLTRL